MGEKFIPTEERVAGEIYEGWGLIELIYGGFVGGICGNESLRFLNSIFECH